MQHSEQINELATALAKAQGAMQPAKKSTPNPYFNSRYADLAALQEAARKPLADNGLAVLMSVDDGGTRLTAKLVHTSGQWMQSDHPIKPQKGDMQAFGSALTYARRYTFGVVTGIVAEGEDDDANATLTVERVQQRHHETVTPARIEHLKRAIRAAETPEVLDNDCVAMIKAANLSAAEHKEVEQAYRKRRHLLRQAAQQVVKQRSAPQAEEVDG